MKSETLLTIILLLFIFFAACSCKNPTGAGSMGRLVITLVEPAREDSLAKITNTLGLDSVRCIISMKGKGVFDKNLNKEGSVFRAQFDLEPGGGYAILLYGMKAGSVAYRGSKSGIEVVAGETTSVPIVFGSFQVTLAQPSSGSITTDSTPAFRWNVLSGAVGYALQVSSSDNFAAFAIDQQNLTSTTYTPGPSLSDGSYYWRVQAKDNLGNWGSWSMVWKITIKTTGPAAPILAAPDSGSTTNDSTPTFTWSAVSDVVDYALQVSASVSFNSVVINQANVTSTSLTPTVALSEGTYYWRVQAKDNLSNWGSWSTVWSFTIKLTGPPAPTLISPANNSAMSDDKPTLSWNAVNGALDYQIQVSLVSNFATSVFDQQALLDTTYSVSSALNDGSYYWRVRAKDDVGNWGGWSVTWNFTVKTIGPNAPILIAPSNGKVTGENVLTFIWSAVATAVSYELQVSPSADFIALAIGEQNLPNTIFTAASALSDGIYYWRVRAMDGVGNWGEWSELWNFTINTSVSLSPTLISPPNGSATADNTPTFDWSDVSDAVSYDFQLSTSDSFTILAIDEHGLINTIYIPADTLPDGIYYWRVRAVDGSGNAWPWASPAWSFTLEAQGPLPPVLSSPEDGRQIDNPRLSFAWQQILNAKAYWLQVSTDAEMNNLVIDKSDLATAAYAPDTALSNATYYWRVRAKSKFDIWGKWSNVWSFIVYTPPPIDGMVYIAAGEFSMGSTDGNPDEQPVHSVYLDGYYMDQHEVTNAQYKAFCDATGRSYPNDPFPGYLTNYPNYPAVNVSWNDAKAYAQWAGKRLPTEAEWEKVARDEKFCPTSTACNHACYDGPRSVIAPFCIQCQLCGKGPYIFGTLSVGSFPPNDYGLYDMGGNVSEWCNDWYHQDYYNNSPTRNPQGPASGSFRVYRGGNWASDSKDVRPSKRSRGIDRNLTIGFRCAKTP